MAIELARSVSSRDQLVFPWFGVSAGPLYPRRRPCLNGSPRRRTSSHGKRLRSTHPNQLSLSDWRPRQKTPDELVAASIADASALLGRLDVAIYALARIARDIAHQTLPGVAPMQTPALAYQRGPGRHPRLDGDNRPRHYSECLARGLGTSHPCPYYSCAAHLGLYVLDDGAVRVLIPPDEIDSEKHTCMYEAGGHEWHPVDIAKQLRVSLGLVELIQRHGVAKTGGMLARVKDSNRGCELDVDGLSDCRS